MKYKYSIILILIIGISSYLFSKIYINNTINKKCLKYDIDKKIVNCIISIESNHNPLAYSSAGAVGLMQVMPYLAKSLGYNRSKYELFLPFHNLEYGVKFLSYLVKRYSFDKAIQCYWSGETLYNKGVRNSNYLNKFKRCYND